MIRELNKRLRQKNVGELSRPQTINTAAPINGEEQGRGKKERRQGIVGSNHKIVGKLV